MRITERWSGGLQVEGRCNLLGAGHRGSSLRARTQNIPKTLSPNPYPLHPNFNLSLKLPLKTGHVGLELEISDLGPSGAFVFADFSELPPIPIAPPRPPPCGSGGSYLPVRFKEFRV